MEAHPSMAPARPQSVKELVAQAENFAFNVNIAMKHWIRAADTLYQEASANYMRRLAVRLHQITDIVDRHRSLYQMAISGEPI
jgi:hypothetical protein